MYTSLMWKMRARHPAAGAAAAAAAAGAAAVGSIDRVAILPTGDSFGTAAAGAGAGATATGDTGASGFDGFMGVGAAGRVPAGADAPQPGRGREIRSGVRGGSEEEAGVSQ